MYSILDITSCRYLYLCFMLDCAAGSTFKWPHLKIMTTGILCRLWDQLQFTRQLVVLRHLYLRLQLREIENRADTEGQRKKKAQVKIRVTG